MLALIFVAIFLAWGICDQAAAVRLKDMAAVQGMRSNQLIGYGLVVGLEGTGDGKGTKFTVQTLVNMLERLGVDVPREQVKVDNVAAVMVTADLPSFARRGSKLDVLVSSLGDAESLQGGTLLLTPLKGVDGQVYALAQGAVSIGGFKAVGAAGGGVQKNFPTVGRIPEGATVERELPYNFSVESTIGINLFHPDFTTATRTVAAINKYLQGEVARAIDAGTIRLEVPASAREDLVGLMARLEQIEIIPDSKARVVVDERTGTVVMGENVRISTVAVAHGSLSIQIKETRNVSQPAPFARRGRTVVTPESDVQVQEGTKRLLLVKEGANIGEVVQALNAVGATPRDLISIFQALKAAGALQAELQII
ncbi:MAG: flagellar basal body P-ring protein FlgI [Deltaproteobacteria bacterium]|nr:flagellar basal body P-ring protein FlgI [Deltaproteobacteria bacterium]MBW2069701.1 flagellar basal body P-ring protein FlgI [Deltaproteobacteria bacterium]